MTRQACLRILQSLIKALWHYSQAVTGPNSILWLDCDTNTGSEKRALLQRHSASRKNRYHCLLTSEPEMRKNVMLCLSAMSLNWARRSAKILLSSGVKPCLLLWRWNILWRDKEQSALNEKCSKVSYLILLLKSSSTLLILEVEVNRRVAFTKRLWNRMIKCKDMMDMLYICIFLW